MIIEVKYTVKPGKRQDFYDAIVNYGIDEESRMEIGNIKYDYRFSDEDPDVLLLHEEWRDEASQHEHEKTAHFSKLKELKEEYVLDTELVVK